ncbi:MAG: histone deacetylase [Elusimicrobiaceae bacterium]|nr:histone deacetylase [Elusimicrobiaceae bacterium]
MKIVVSPRYTAAVPGHNFINAKFYQTALELAARGVISADMIIEPDLPDRETLLLAHSPDWTDRVLNNALTAEEIAAAEHPFTPEISSAHQLACTGGVLAAGLALKAGLGLHCGGGGHHAGFSRGGGYCFLNDIAVAVNWARRRGGIRKAAVIDLDAHQGDGTAGIFSAEPDVFTFSMHNGNIFPQPPVPGDLDIPLEPGTGGAEYLAKLEPALERVFESGPEFVMYLAGADCFRDDRLGGLALSAEELRRRDELVFSACLKRGIPVAVALGGGYARNPGDTVRLHANTLEAGLAVYGFL